MSAPLPSADRRTVDAVAPIVGRSWDGRHPQLMPNGVGRLGHAGTRFWLRKWLVGTHFRDQKAEDGGWPLSSRSPASA
jgi:hypothetical protein